MAVYLASALGESGSILSASETQRRGGGISDTARLVTKVKARITSLLQDKSIEGRWTAVVLAKAAVEAGQWEILRGCEPWVRSLLTILGKPDPVSSKKLSIITVTRVFQLTQQYPTLIREITTPCLPSFVTACLNIISVKSALDGSRRLKQNHSLVITVFSAFLELLPSHPTIFRPFSAQIHDLLLPLIGSIGSADFISDTVVSLAQRLFVCLHHCAPKNTSGEEWLKAYRSTILAAHQAGDQLFRGIREQWESIDAEIRQSSKSRNYCNLVGDEGPDPLRLRGWNGVQEGSGRLVSLLRLLSQFLSMRTHLNVSIPIGSTLDLTARLTSLNVPVSENENGMSNLIIREIGQDERDSLFSELPKIYVSTLDLLCAIVEVSGTSSISIAQNCLDQALWVFDSAKPSRAVRVAVYRCISTVLPIIGYTLTKSGLSLLAPAIQSSCFDLLPQSPACVKGNQSMEKNPKAKGNHMAINADAFLNTNAIAATADNRPSDFQEMQFAAFQLLINALTCVPTELFPLSLRAEIDRTAILTGSAKLMMASVLNPIPRTGKQRGHASIMPFLARNRPNDLEVEGLLRPRMPVLVTSTGKSKIDFAAQQEDIGVESEMFRSLEHGITEQSTRSTVLADSVSKLMDMDSSQVDTRGTKRDREVDNRAQMPAPSLETQPAIASPDKKARLETHLTLDAISQSTELGEQKSTLNRTNALEQPWENKPTISWSAFSTAFSLSSISSTSPKQTRSESPFRPTTGAMTQNEIVTTGNSEDMTSDDEIPQLNIEPDTDEDDDDISIQ
ncbi:hypothetical protein PRK78_002049 [Emydomyces testavorans]|uniref:Pre-rRNA-processing protein RIX1 n=1 Tax=Emydomyces testavorans TaxID=2070801 RepID=A0AAF0DFM4_9EURO|nr:hypothetical protein PRK78_002049 [Emydomyces testavorans]